jgi:ubiquitin-like protein ATG12
MPRPPVAIRFKAVGNAPIMKQNFYKITVGNRFQAVIHFLRRQLGWKASDPLVRVLHVWSDVWPHVSPSSPT